MFIGGYDKEPKGYYCYNPKTHTLHINNDVKVYEGCFWYNFAITIEQPHVTLELVTSHSAMIEAQDPFTSHSSIQGHSLK